MFIITLSLGEAFANEMQLILHHCVDFITAFVTSVDVLPVLPFLLYF